MKASKRIMIQGTGSSVGKSILTAGLCRIFYQDGFETAPFKSQNMALNSYITADGGEMGRAQVVQAEACGKAPDVRMNPILLKPTTDRKAQVILNGKVHNQMDAVSYHAYKPQLADAVKRTFDSLVSENDIVVIEGAGSPAEINLRENDLVNMGMAEMADSPVLLVGDIDKGGVFASLYGTIMLLTPEERARIKGMIINKFRGDVEILKPGLKMIEDLTGVPVLGVVPYSVLKIEDEDSLSERFKREQDLSKKIQVEVLYLPHVSNFTDFDALEILPDVNVRYVMRGEAIHDPDLLIIPGSKNTIEDLMYLKNAGLDEQIIRLYRRGKRVVGICGGYQILGKSIADPHATESAIERINGLGLLDTETLFETVKTTTQVTAKVEGFFGDLSHLNGEVVKGYEIHMGQTKRLSGEPLTRIIEQLGEEVLVEDGAISPDGRVFGTYIHGIFDNSDFTNGLLNVIRKEKGLDSLEANTLSYEAFKAGEYDKLAKILRDTLDMDAIYEICGLEKPKLE